MYYEEKVINGTLCFRSTPDGRWKEVNSIKGIAFKNINALNDEERLSLFNMFCKHCGSKDARCQCWNDE